MRIGGEMPERNRVRKCDRRIVACGEVDVGGIRRIVPSIGRVILGGVSTGLTCPVAIGRGEREGARRDTRYGRAGMTKRLSGSGLGMVASATIVRL
jgi:hypothetical protein